MLSLPKLAIDMPRALGYMGCLPVGFLLPDAGLRVSGGSGGNVSNRGVLPPNYHRTVRFGNRGHVPWLV